MVTLTLEDRSEEVLGSLAWLGNDTLEENASFFPSALGEAVKEEWLRLEEEVPQLEVIKLQLMPEHLHVVVFATERLEKPLGKYVGILKNRCNKHYWRELTEKGLLGKKGEEAPPSLFSEGFTDSILMHEGQLEAMIRYLELNPYRALTKRSNPELFRVVSRLVVRAAQREAGEAAQPSCTEQDRPEEQNRPSCTEQDRKSHTEQDRLEEQDRKAELSREQDGKGRPKGGGLGAKELGSFAAIGNRFLLERPMRMQVRCHNNKTEENLRLIARQKEYFLERARRGGVIVSPCISEGEKEIARAALEEGLPLIVILENGFPPMYKPPGIYFEACAKGLLLMLAPWEYHMERRTITREQCLELNEMAFQISTEPWTEAKEKEFKNSGKMLTR